MMAKKNLFLADLTHVSKGKIHCLTFPLGIGCIGSYLNEHLGEEFRVKLFKYPNKLYEHCRNDMPSIVGFSNYAWNLELSHEVARIIKSQDPKVIIIFGGPNFPISDEERMKFLTKYNQIDFYIENEGEVSFQKLVKKIVEFDFNVAKLKGNNVVIDNCSYLVNQKLIKGEFKRIPNIDVIPSPYLSGLMDEFFDEPLAPMIETTRGCPFSCTYCSDGKEIRSKISRHNEYKIDQELKYIAVRRNKMEELILVDDNFGSYKEDLVTAHNIRKLQDHYKYPNILQAGGGKNNKGRIIECAKILGGSWLIGASIQSSSETVLKNINRKGILFDTFYEFINTNKELNKESLTFTDIILGLPGDTKEAHFESLRFAVESGINSVRMFQTMLLIGAELSSKESRREYSLRSKYRFIPNALGTYQFGDVVINIAEVEEIIVSNQMMTLEDYLDCRLMNLLVETYINNASFEELFLFIENLGIPKFMCLRYVYDHPELFPSRLSAIIDQFVAETKEDLFDTPEEMKFIVNSDHKFQQYVNEEKGIKELLVFKSKLYLEFQEITSVLLEAIKAILIKEHKLDDSLVKILDEIAKFIVCKNQDFFKTKSYIYESFNYDFDKLYAMKFRVDPSHIDEISTNIKFCFFHNSEQKQHISNCKKFYENTQGGLARLIQRSNLQKMYRSFKKVTDN